MVAQPVILTVWDAEAEASEVYPNVGLCLTIVFLEPGMELTTS